MLPTKVLGHKCAFMYSRRDVPRFVRCPKALGLSSSDVTASREDRSELVYTEGKGGVAGEPRRAGEPGGAPHRHHASAG